jgi:hypothetical protein
MTAIGQGDRIEFGVYDSTGQAIMFVKYSVPLASVSLSEIGAVRKNADAIVSRQPRRGTATAQRSQLDRAIQLAAKTHPALTAIRLLEDGTIWARGDSAATREHATWHVFNSRGEHVGAVRLPWGVSIVGGTSKRMLALSRGAPDWPLLAWYAVGVLPGPTPND